MNNLSLSTGNIKAERGMKKHRTTARKSLKDVRIGLGNINGDDGEDSDINKKELNNAAVYVKSLLSNFLENASSDDKKVYRVNEELDRIKQDINTNANVILGRSKTKVINKGNENNINQKKKLSRNRNNKSIDDDNNDTKQQQQQHTLPLIIKDHANSIINNNTINDSKESNNNTNTNINTNNNIKQSIFSNSTPHFHPYQLTNPRRNTILFPNQSNFTKLLQEKRQSASINTKNHIRGSFQTPKINSNTNPSTLPFKNRLSSISNDFNHKTTFNHPYHPIVNTSSTKIKPIDQSTEIVNNSTDIRNVIPLDKTNYKAFNALCSELKSNLINHKQSPQSPHKNQHINSNLSLSLNPNSKANSNTKVVDSIKKYQNDSCNEEDNSTNYNLNTTSIQELRYRAYLYNKPVYDSLSDEESDEELSGVFYIDPNSTLKNIIDFLVIISSLYSIIFIPYYLAFDISINFTHFSFRILIETSIDILFLIDLFIGFFTAYYNFEEQFITKLQLIIKHYLMHWFIIDFICAFPCNSLILFLRTMNILPKNNTYSNNSIQLIEMLCLAQIIKLFKVSLSNSITKSFIKMCNEIDAISHWIRLYFSLIIFILSVYLLSCIFIFLGRLDYPNWIDRQGYNYKHQHIDVLITSFYYICTTVFTIGYGDVISISNYERFFNLFLLVVGIMIYSWAVTALSNFVQNVDSKTMEFQKKMGTLDIIRLAHENMPTALYEKISRFLNYKLHNEKRDKNDIIDNLPIGLRNKLIMEMYKSIIGNFIFFKNFNNTDFIIKVLLALKPIQAMKNERLVKEGDYIEEIIFVKRGSLALEIPLPVQLKDEMIQSIQTKNTLANATVIKGIGNRRGSVFNLHKVSTLLQHNNNNTNNNSIPSEPQVITIDDNYENLYINTKTKNKTSIGATPLLPQYVKIIEIRRNEHFGDILMFLNKRSPLSLKVKSKVAELLYLKKTDAVEISMSFPVIWRKIIKKSLFNMEQIERLMNKSLKFFFIHHEGINRKKGKKCYNNIRMNGCNNNKYYRKDIEKVNTFVNAKTYVNEPGFDEACELRSVPSLDNSVNNYNEETGIILEGAEYEEREESQSLNQSPQSDIISESDEDKESEINTNIIKEEEHDDDDDDDDKDNNDDDYVSQMEENEEVLSHNTSSVQDTIRMIINNKKIDYSIDNDTNNNDDNKRIKYAINSKKSLISQEHDTITMPYSYEEINNEYYPNEKSIDLNSYTIPNILNILPQHNTIKSNTNSLISSSNTHSLYTATLNLHPSSNEEDLQDLDQQTLTIKTIKLPNQKPKSSNKQITHLMSFTIESTPSPKNLMTPFKPIIPNAISQSPKKKGHHRASTLLSTSKHQVDCRTSKITKGLLKDHNARLSKSKSLQPSLNSVDTRRLSQLMIQFTKEDNQENSEKSNRNDGNDSINESIESKQSSEVIQHEKGISSYPINNRRRKGGFIGDSDKQQSTLDVISQNIQRNMMNLSNPKYFYSNYFSQVMNKKTDVKDKNKLLKEKLKTIAKIIETNHPSPVSKAIINVNEKKSL